MVPFAGEADWDGELRRRAGASSPAIGAGTTYPDYKPAPFIVCQEVDGVDLVTVVTEGIFSYCGVKVKIDTDRHLGPEAATVRADGEAVGHVTTGEYGSQMLSLGGVHHLTGGSKKEGRVTCETLLALCNGKPVELVDRRRRDASSSQAGKAPVVDGKREERMRVGCGSATIGMFAEQWRGQVDEVVVVDDHITGVLSEHQAGKLLGWRDTGIKIMRPPLDARPLLPGRRARHRLGRHRHLRSAGHPRAIRTPRRARGPACAADGVDHRRAVRLLRARRRAAAGRRKPSRSACARSVERIERELRAGAVHGAVHGRRRRLAARRRDRESRAA